MSHFCCLVITPNKPTQDELAEILQPWHEYESTEVRDQYVVEVDITDQVHEAFNKPVDVVVLNPGNETEVMVSRYDDILYTKESEDEWGKQFELPPGAECRTISAEDARKVGLGYATLSFAAKEYYGSDVIERDGKFYDLTNPLKKWDWWVIGGRWTGMLIPNYKPEDDPRNKEVCNLCGGSGKRTDAIAKDNPEQMERCNGCAGEGTRTKWPTQWIQISGDQACLEDIPLLTLRDEAEKEALDRYDRAHEIIAGRPIPKWNEIKARYEDNLEVARVEYHENPVKKELMEANIISPFDDLDNFALTREQVAVKARAGVICPFAYVLDGKWYERGEMGWWAVVHNEQDKESWTTQFQAMLDSLPKSYWLTVVDCHI